ncbi:MAG: hypothetical protein N3F63_00700 [Thermoplasmata archaeon]|nr:hypothetical protein [Thermoplasmata archaeon]
MQKEKIASLIDEIARMPEMKDVPREQIEATVNEIVGKLSLQPNEIREVVLNRLAPQKEIGGEPVNLSRLRAGMRNVSVMGKILFVSDGPLKMKDGSEKRVLKGLITDNTKKLNFVVWNPEKYPGIIEKGAVLSFKNIYTTEWQGEPQINTSEVTEITSVSEDQLPNVRLGTPVKIKDLPGVRFPVTLSARVISVEKKTVKVGDEEKILFTGILADETGHVHFTAWKDFNLKEDEVVKINGAYKKIWKDMHSVVLDEKTTVERLDSSKLPPATQLLAPKEVLIEDIYEEGEGFMSNVQIEGFLIEVKETSGLVYRCADCGMVLDKGMCKTHGKVKESRTDLRIKGVVDDGTGAIIAIFPQEVCEKLLGKGVGDYISLVGKNGVVNPALWDINERLLGRAFNLRGNVSTGEFGTTFLVKDAQNLQIDCKAEAESLLSEMEV